MSFTVFLIGWFYHTTNFWRICLAFIILPVIDKVRVAIAEARNEPLPKPKEHRISSLPIAYQRKALGGLPSFHQDSRTHYANRPSWLYRPNLRGRR
jgi:hypothetical protein